MIAETKSYAGVSCVRCSAPIPVPAKVVSLQDEIAKGETNAPYTFVVRCKACSYETVYEIRGVQKFDGEPARRERKARAQAA